jgi:hypothetical protein
VAGSSGFAGRRTGFRLIEAEGRKQAVGLIVVAMGLDFSHRVGPADKFCNWGGIGVWSPNYAL